MLGMTRNAALGINWVSKRIPYPGDSEPREDGEQNHGFMNLKQDSELLERVPELQDHPALKRLVEVLNRPDSGTFSIGCLADLITEEGGQGFGYTGYVEFAFDSIRLASDASNYFQAFFDFDKFMFLNKCKSPVFFHWEIQPGGFLSEEGEVIVTGCSVSVVLEVRRQESAEAALSAYDEGLEALMTYCVGRATVFDDPIYGNQRAV